MELLLDISCKSSLHLRFLSAAAEPTAPKRAVSHCSPRGWLGFPWLWYSFGQVTAGLPAWLLAPPARPRPDGCFLGARLPDPGLLPYVCGPGLSLEGADREQDDEPILDSGAATPVSYRVPGPGSRRLRAVHPAPWRGVQKEMHRHFNPPPPVIPKSIPFMTNFRIGHQKCSLCLGTYGFTRIGV